MIPRAPVSDPRWLRVAPAVGGLAMVAIVVVLSQPLPGILAITTVVICLGSVLWHQARTQPPQAWPHLLCVVLSGVSLLGLCASRCGSMTPYATLGGVPTALIGILVHAAVSGVLVAVARGQLPASCAPQLVGLAGGGSLFYGAMLAAHGSWCGACVAIHALMAAQCLALLRAPGMVARAGVLLALMASAGSLNAVYHHRLVSARVDDAQDLLAYLRSAWNADSSPQRIQPISEEIHAAIRTGAALRAQLRQRRDQQAQDVAMRPAAAGESEASAVALVADHQPRSHAADATASTRKLRSHASANAWGRSQAAVTLLVGIDSGCPVCAQEFRQILELQDLVEQGELQVRFLIGYRTDTAQAMASLAYAGGLLGERPLLECLGRFYLHQREILIPSDAIAVLPASLPAAQAIAMLRDHHDTISGLLADADNLKQQLGATGDPTLWLESAGSSGPQRTFQGLTMSAILRLAVISLEDPGRDAAAGSHDEKSGSETGELMDPSGPIPAPSPQTLPAPAQR